MLSTASSPQAECFISMGLVWVQSLPRLESSVSWCWATLARQAGEHGRAAGGQGRPLERLGLAAQAFGATEGWH